ncbi:MAG: YeeE/YedE family protein [Burkholderiaceae bacterium]
MLLQRSGLLLAGLLGVLTIVFFAGLQAGLLVLLGIGFGLALQGFRFGFTTGWRVLILQKDPRGVYGQMLLMALAAGLTLPLIASHPSELVGAVSPISYSLILGAFVFGLAMQLADGCGSGTLYKAGASAPLSWVVLPAFIVGSTVGASHQPAWLALGGPFDQQGQAVSLDLLAALGPWAALLVTIVGCAAVTWLAYRRSLTANPPIESGLSPALRRWLIGGLILAVLYAIHLIVAGQPWGIVYGLGLWGAKIASGMGADFANDAFWGVAPHAQRLAEPVLWDITSLTNIGLLFGALLSAKWSAEHQANTDKSLSRLRLQHWLTGIVAGLVMGYASRLAFGCNIGAFLGGVASASLHGWVWFAMAFLGSMVGVRIRLKVQMP